MDDYTGNQHDHSKQHQPQSQSRPTPLQDSVRRPRLDQFNSPHYSNESGSGSGSRSGSASTSTNTSTRLVSPNMTSAIHDGYSLGKGLDPTNFHGYYAQASNSNSNSSSSAFTSSTPFQTGYGGSHFYSNSTDTNSAFSLSPMTGNQYMMNPDFGLNFQNLTGHGRGHGNDDDTASIWQNAQSMFGNYDFMNANTNNPIPINNNINLNTNQSLPTSASTQALFHSTDSGLQNIPTDQAAVPTTHNRCTRSPSPLHQVDEMEVDGQVEEETSSPELTEIQSQSRPRYTNTRRASESTPGLSRSRSPSTSSKRRNHSINISTGTSARRLSTSRLDSEEKSKRAAAAEGLDKGGKRRMQNKLAQRAFRARSKVTNKHAAGRLEHLEEVTEQQASRIGNLTELVGRLQKENYALKSAKFQETLMKSEMQGQGQSQGGGGTT